MSCQLLLAIVSKPETDYHLLLRIHATYRYISCVYKDREKDEKQMRVTQDMYYNVLAGGSEFPRDGDSQLRPLVLFSVGSLSGGALVLSLTIYDI